MTSFPRRAFLWVMLVAVAARVLLLASNTVSFHSDEAIVGLMARHILQGERPTFFYGQAYMGSLDAWLVAIVFLLLGESVLTIRVVQSILYVLVVASGFLVAWRLSERIPIAVVAGLVLAISSVDVALYTTATLGGYNEILLLGNLLLLFAYEVTHDHTRSVWRWAALGTCAGLGWWTNGLIVMYALPIGVMIVYRILYPSPQPPPRIQGGGEKRATFLRYLLLALVFFIIGSAPWWVFDFTHDHAALSTYITNRQSGEFAGVGLPYIPPTERALGLVLIGLPTLFGMKFPWEASYFLPPVGVIVVVIYAVAVGRLLRGHDPLEPDARGLMLGMIGLFCLIFVASTFGADPTGRYFVVLALPFGIVLGTLLEANVPFLGGRTRYIVSLPIVAVGLVIGYQAVGQIAAANSATGLTTQFDLVSHIPNDHDTDLIAFLDEQGIYNGYTNYWVAFRIAFLSGERMQFSSALPYKTSLDYNPADNRYPPYAEATEQAERIAYITTNLPTLDARLEADWAAQGITYEETQIGVFHVYYGFAPEVPSQNPGAGE